MPARRAPCPSCGAPVPREQLVCPACAALVAPGAAAVEALAAVAPASQAEIPPSAAAGAASEEIPHDALVALAAATARLGDGTLEPDAEPPDAASVDDREGSEATTLEADPEPYPVMHVPVLTAASAGGNSRAGAYLPPSAVRTGPGSFAAIPRDTSPAFAYSTGEASGASSAWSPTSSPWAPSAPIVGRSDPAVAVGSEAKPGRASLLSDLPFDPPADLPGRLVAIGAIGGAIAFVLPWAPQVLGSSSFDDSYWGQWGLGAPSHLAPFLLMLALGMLTVLPNAVPAWLKTGIAPVLLGGFLLGLLWPYLVGGFGSRLGATLEAVAAFLLVAGGAVALAPRRSLADEAPRDA